MKKGRSSYSCQFNCEASLVDRLVQSYLNANNFIYETKNGESYFKSGNNLKGFKYFSYNISGQTLTVTAWFHSLFGDAQIEHNGLDIIAMEYQKSLAKLFEEVSKLHDNITPNNSLNNNSTGYSSVNQTDINKIPNSSTSQYTPNYYNMNTSNNAQDFSQTFNNQVSKKQETMAEFSFWFSLVGLFVSIFGYAFGFLINIIILALAYQGLDTKKGGKAKIAIVITIVSIIISFLYLFGIIGA